jgi:hypothetical protein
MEDETTFEPDWLSPGQTAMLDCIQAMRDEGREGEAFNGRWILCNLSDGQLEAVAAFIRSFDEEAFK